MANAAETTNLQARPGPVEEGISGDSGRRPPPAGRDAEVRFLQGVIALQDGRYEAAVAAFEGAIALDPTNPDYYYKLATAFFALGSHERSMACLDAALGLRPDHADALRDLGRLLAARGSHRGAVEYLTRAAAVDRDDARLRVDLGLAMVLLDRPDDAVRWFQDALDLRPLDPEVLRHLGQVHSRRGRLDEAAESYRRALLAGTDDPDLHNELGIVLARRGRHEEAAESYRRAIKARSDLPDAHNNLGNALRNLGKVDEAVASYGEALRLRPNYPEAHNNLGIALRRKGKVDEAIASYGEALRLRPSYAEAHNNLGFAYSGRGKLDAAIVCYGQAVRIKPDYVEARHNLGNALSDAGRHAEAVESLRRAVAIRPGDPKLHRSLAVALGRGEKFDEAIAAAREAIRLNPGSADLHNDLGIFYARTNRFDEAEASYREAVRRRPGFAEAHNNLGNALRCRARFVEALDCYAEALRLKPEYPDALNNRGIALSEVGRFDEAIDSYTRCIRLRPNHIDARMNRSLTWLRKGDYAQGWAEYEWRWKRRVVSSRPLIQPLWNGFPLKGRRILLITEQGLGDTMHCIRFAPLLKAQGATVILECPEKLIKLLARSPGIDEVVPQGRDFPEYDVYVPLMSIPGLVDTALETIPAEVPYIHPDPDLVESWRRELSGRRGFKVGINWQGNPKYGGDRHRSMPLALFEPLSRVPGVELFSLQKNFGSEQIAEVAGKFDVVDLGGRLDGEAGPFMDTAAVMKNLDLFVTSDTAVAHLAGAMGVPVWVALSATPGWQWLSEREDCPWYPTMRLFRQETLMDWPPVFARIADELSRLVPPPPREPIAVEATVGELLDLIARIQAEVDAGVGPEDARDRLERLDAARLRSIGDDPEAAAVVSELRAIHRSLRQSERDLQAFEREEDFGPRFVTLARLASHERARRAELMQRLDTENRFAPVVR